MFFMQYLALAWVPNKLMTYSLAPPYHFLCRHDHTEDSERPEPTQTIQVYKVIIVNLVLYRVLISFLSHSQGQEPAPSIGVHFVYKQGVMTPPDLKRAESLEPYQVYRGRQRVPSTYTTMDYRLGRYIV